MKPETSASATFSVQAVKGMKDAVGPDARAFAYVEEISRGLSRRWGYQEIRTPILESTDLFVRSAGEASDVMVSKQMYTFTDPGERSNTMRPEGTAGVVRALVEAGSFKLMPVNKFYYAGPMFRYERPQKGRLRQFHQFGLEYFGVAHAAADAEMIYLCDALLRTLGFTSISTHINTIGCRDCRPAYNEALRAQIAANSDGWCSQCRERARVNPMRVFDCKVPGCNELMKSLPRIHEQVCAPCAEHFQQVKSLLDAGAIPYQHDDSLVRGFDYYSRTVFEVMEGGIGAQSAVLGGGRYDYLVEELGGPATPAVGMAVGMERLLLAMESRSIAIPPDPAPDYYIAALDDESVSAALIMAQQYSAQDKSVYLEGQPKSFKAALKNANRLQAGHAVIIGSSEREKGLALLKNLKTGEQTEVPIAANDSRNS